jgi:hypothetical protein
LVNLCLARVPDLPNNVLHHLPRQTANLTRLYEVTASNRIHELMPVCPHSHRKLHLFEAYLVRVKARLHGDNIIKWCKSKAPAGRKTNAEVLSMSVRCPQ